MNLPAFRHLAFATLVIGVGLAAPTRVHAQDCGGGDSGGGDPGGGDPASGFADNGGNGDGADQGSGSGGDNSGFTDTLDPNWDSTMTTWNFFAQADESNTGAPVVVTVNASPNVYAGSPTGVSSSAGFADGPVIGHSIEYINADGSIGGVWTTDVAYPVTSISNRSINITFPSPGTYYVRGGASVLFRNGQNPWIYSDQETVTVNDPMTNYIVAIQTHPKPGMEKWVLSSNVVTKDFQVIHTNP